MAKKIGYIVVDVEANGPCPGIYSMTELGAVVLEDPNGSYFYANFKPITTNYIEEALAVTHTSFESTFKFSEPYESTLKFKKWLEDVKEFYGYDRLVMFSDNPAFDWQFINYYFHFFLNENPLGWSARRIGDLYCGKIKKLRGTWKHLRDTTHDHNPVNDAKGNAEALNKILKDFS